MPELSGSAGAPAFERGITRDNFVLRLPFFLAEALPFEGALDAARTMALGNAFGAAHFLAQDDEMDGDARPSPSDCCLSDRSLILFMLEYGRLFRGDGSFAFSFVEPLVGYLREYFASLEWRKEVLESPEGRDAVSGGALPATLEMLGRGMSPLKVCPAAVAALSGRNDALPAMESVIDRFHTAYQLADDLEDLEADLEAGRWSVPSWLLAAAARLEEPPPASRVGDVLLSQAGAATLALVAGEIDRHYAMAAEAALAFGAEGLASHLERRRDESRERLGWVTRRVSVTAAASGNAAPAVPTRDARVPPELARKVHAFEVRSRGLVLDVDSGLFFEADAAVLDVVEWLRAGSDPGGLGVLNMNAGKNVVGEVLGELRALARPEPWPKGSGPGDLRSPCDAWAAAGASSGLTAVALGLTDSCNLSCDYCYLSSGGRVREGRPGARDGSSMSRTTAFRAVDLLLSESAGEARVSIVFFGGEPLLEPALIGEIVDYARRRAGAEGRSVSFHMTTNGTLLTPENASFLHGSGVRALVSVDGGAAEHDAHRVFRDGTGSYDTIVRNLRELPVGMRVGARATVTPDSRPLAEIAEHLRGLGLYVVHFAPVSGAAMSREFADRLALEFEELAEGELAAVARGDRPSTGNFTETVLALETGARRRTPCGAGTRYVSVDPSGALSFCHRFAGNPGFAVGDVERGLDRERVGNILRRFRDAVNVCAGCWAVHLCGGPCVHDLEAAGADAAGPDAVGPDAVGPDSPRCRLKRRIFELSMWIYASLPDEQRSALAAAARGSARPEIATGRESRTSRARR
jgi:uncharacterized protein